MSPVIVRNVIIGEGRPKVCVPLVERTEEALLQAAARIGKFPVDLVEWRADFYEAAPDGAALATMAGKLRERIGEKPILFTLRTASEGGEKQLTAKEYSDANKDVISSGFIDLIDIEMMAGDAQVDTLIRFAHQFDVKVICSSHDFHKTPSKDRILRRLQRMQDMGADIVKAAVMPQTRGDVLTLLDATLTMKELYARVPVITMSMSSLGLPTRLMGETFGSAITFGAVGKASAPGQIDAEDLMKVLDVIHKAM